MSEKLQAVANHVVRLAKEQSYVVPTDVRRLLRDAGLSEALWKDVLGLINPPLRYQRGRYCYEADLSESARELREQQLRVERAVRKLLKFHRKQQRETERREKDRALLVEPVIVKVQDGRRLHLLTRDVSPTGIRLIGTHRLLGQKIEVLLQSPADHCDAPTTTSTFHVRVLWTRAVGDGMFENGGSLLDVTSDA